MTKLINLWNEIEKLEEGSDELIKLFYFQNKLSKVLAC